MEVTVPNLNYFIDWDGDGIAGNEPDAGGDVTLTLDKEELEIPAEGGTFRVKIDCKVPVTLEKPAGIPGESISVETLSFPISIIREPFRKMSWRLWFNRLPVLW